MSIRKICATAIAALSLAGCVYTTFDNNPIESIARTVGDIDRRVESRCKVSPDPSDVAAIAAAAPPLTSTEDVVAAICAAFATPPSDIGILRARPGYVYGIHVRGHFLRQ